MVELEKLRTDASDDDWSIPPTSLVRPRSVGRGLPVPPVVPFVAIFSILAGIMLGFRLAPTPAPSTAAARPTAVVISTPTPAPTPAGPKWSFLSIIGPVEILDPPEGGLTLDQLLAQIAEPGLRIAPTSILSARVARYNQVSSVAGSSNQWVWVLVVKGSSEVTVRLQDCGIGSVSAAASAAQVCFVGHTTNIVILDYMTGGFLEAQSWANP